jgi:DNA-binding NtrC family response regulator
MWFGRDDRTSKETPVPRLLVIDDEESICFSMSEYFSLHGFKVDTACEIEEAEKLLGATTYKVVIQDLRLTMTSNHDGLHMIKTIRQSNPQTRIVVLTAYGSAEIEDEARRCGADAFLRKPKPLSQVAQVVQGLLESPPRQAARPA